MSAHVWNPRFVYRNWLNDSPFVVVTASDEVTGMEDDYLQSYQPQEVWRADTLSSLNVAVSMQSAGARLWDTAWLGYTNATAKRNAMLQSDSLDTTWTATNATVANSALAIAPLAGLAHSIEATGIGEHGIEQTWTPTLTMQAGQQFTAYFYVNFSESGGAEPDGVQLAMNANGSVAVSVQLDFATVTLGSVTEGSGWSGSTASVETVVVGGITSYRFILTATFATAVTSMEFELRMVEGGSVSFVSSGELVRVSQCFLGLGSSTEIERPTTTERLSGLRLVAGTASAQNFYPLAARDLTHQQEDRGWIHGAAYCAASPSSDTSWTLHISDEANLDGYFQAGRLVIGKAFQPQAAITGGAQSNQGYMASVDRVFKRGRSVYSIELGFLTQDAVRELWDMNVYCNPAGSDENLTEAEGGQIYSKGRRPVLFLADDAAESYEPERIIYGYVSVRSIDSDRNGLSRARIEIEELLP